MVRLIEKGFKLDDFWTEKPWQGDMPDDYVYAFAMISRNIENEKIQQFARI